MKKIAWRWVGVLSLGFLVWGCRTAVLEQEEVQLIYDRTAGIQYADRNPVIVIPGSGGSRLVHEGSGKVVWGAIGRDVADPANPLDVPLISLPLRSTDPHSGVHAAGVLEYVQVRLLGLSLQFKAYFHILQALGAGGYRDEDSARQGLIRYDDDHFTCFQFDYDWRLDVAANARRLGEFIAQKQIQVQAKTRERFGVERESVRFDLVGHSLGGLLIRYYLRYGDQDLPADGSLPVLDWRGADQVERVILVGPPNAGSYKAVLNLVKGSDNGPGLPSYPPAMLGSFPASYQLLPRSRHGLVVDGRDPKRRLDLFDLDTWLEMEIGLAAPNQDEVLQQMIPDVADAGERRKIALDFLERALRRAERLHQALDVPARPPEGTELILITGDSERTGQTMAISPGVAEIKDYGLGDGSVLRSSALMDERLGRVWQPRLISPISWEDVVFLEGRHLLLTRSPQFTNNMLYRLLEEPRVSGR